MLLLKYSKMKEDILKRQVSDEQLRELKNIDTPTVSNAIEQFHLRPLSNIPTAELWGI